MEISSLFNNFDRYPEKAVPGHSALQGWGELLKTLSQSCPEGVLVAEFYPGVSKEEIIPQLEKLGGVMLNAEDYALSDTEYRHLIEGFLTEDRVFGIMNVLRLDDAYPPSKLEEARKKIASIKGLVVVYGTGASVVAHGDCLVYFDMPRWEIQCRFQQGMANWKTQNENEDKLRKFKQGYFLEWRMADRQKRKLLGKLDFIVDTVVPCQPKIVEGDAFRDGLQLFASQPFRLVPYYAPEVWGGQWMKQVCGLDPSAENYAWSFDGVPEENSIFMRFGDIRMEFPALDVVFYCPRKLLGDKAHARFGDEFPIRFDFLDTMGGQNLSLQVHPSTEYIQNTFGMHYTQDESYYILDSSEDAEVYLGLKEGIDPGEMLKEISRAQEDDKPFEADRFVNAFPAKKHDHFLIPAGTIHCSGKNTMVLEISATPYIFTFKLWDWGRVGLDGEPRPVHLNHGSQVIQWDRTTQWVKENLVNQFEFISELPGFTETKTGLHEREFIETRRYDLKSRQAFTSQDSVSMCNVVDGKGVIISSPDGGFPPFEAHYAETFILPASILKFCLEPLDGQCVVLRAWVR
jgi:mannose-6-phosphate isomerase class I